MRQAVFFDIDGTLTSSAITSSAGYLAELVGHTDLVTAAEADYAAGRATNHEVCNIDASGYAGVSTDQVAAWLEGLPLIDGVADVVEHCRRRACYPVLASLAWRPVSDALAHRFGFLTSGGPELEEVRGVYTGRVARYFDEYDKRDCAARTAAGLGVPLDRCLAVGDSRSDLPLFAVVAGSIAVNASEACAAAASECVVTSDLREVLPVVDTLLAALPV